MLSGRSINDRDVDEKNPMVVVNESFAKFFFPNVDPIGKHILQGPKETPIEIVGVMRDTKHYGLDQETRPGVIHAYAQRPRSSIFAVLRTSVDPHSVLAEARDAVRSVDAELPIDRAMTMTERLDADLWARRAYSWLFGIFALIAVLLAAAGVYGVTSYVVGQRSREIGIRMALGAVPAQILAGVLRTGMALVAAGMILGIAGALTTARFLETLMF